MYIATTQEELDGIDRTRTYKAITPSDFSFLSIAGVIPEGHLVAGRIWFNPEYLAQGGDIGAPGTGDREIVKVQRVLRANVATDAAFAAGCATSLHHSKFVRMLHAGRAEIDGDVGKAELFRPAEATSSVLPPARLGRQAGLRDRIDIEHVRHEIVVGIESSAGVSSRPALVEHGSGRSHQHVGVDERATTQPGGLNDAHFLAEFYIEEALVE